MMFMEQISHISIVKWQRLNPRFFLRRGDAFELWDKSGRMIWRRPRDSWFLSEDHFLQPDHFIIGTQSQQQALIDVANNIREIGPKPQAILKLNNRGDFLQYEENTLSLYNSSQLKMLSTKIPESVFVPRRAAMTPDYSTLFIENNDSRIVMFKVCYNTQTLITQKTFDEFRYLSHSGISRTHWVLNQAQHDGLLLGRGSDEKRRHLMRELDWFESRSIIVKGEYLLQVYYKETGARFYKCNSVLYNNDQHELILQMYSKCSPIVKGDLVYTLTGNKCQIWRIIPFN